MAQLTRRSFVQVVGMTAATAALAACGNTAATADNAEADALYETKESRGGQIIYTKVIPGEWSAE